MRHARHLVMIPLAASLLLAGCPLGSTQAPRSHAPAAAVETLLLKGRVAFPARAIAATSTDALRRATVSVIDANQQTVAATLTDAEGAFSLALGFNPAPGAFFVVEAIKPLSSGDSGGRVVRLRTLVQWTGNAWRSCSGADVALTPATTAVCVIKATQPGLGFQETMGVVANEAVVSTHPTLNTHWASVKAMVATLLEKDLDPLGGIVTEGTGYALASDRAALFQPNLAQGGFSGTWTLLDGSVQLAGSLPRPGVNDDALFVAASGVGAAVIATDGTHLFLKNWAGAPSAWKRYGTGYGGTTAGTQYGDLVNPTSQSISGGHYGGYVYQAQYSPGSTTVLERVNAATNAVSTVSVSAPLLFRDNGLSSGGTWAALVSDGNFLYNGAWSSDRTSYQLRVYDPLRSFAFVRQIPLTGANTPLSGTTYPNGNSSFLVDGVYAYAMEWIANQDAGNGTSVYNGMARMRRYRLSDGQLETETTFKQKTPTDDPITGCYDPVRNKFWFATYQSANIHRTPGRSFPGSGTWTSPPIDLGGVAPLYGRLNFTAVTTEAGQAVRLRIRSADDPNTLQGASWYGPTGTGDHYTTSGTAVNPIHQRNRWAQIQATLVASTDSVTVANTTPRLYGVSLEAVP